MFFTSDTHFGHGSIIRMAGRPFADLAEMEREMVDRWNAVVRPNDDVWHLGDFAHTGDDDAIGQVFRRLHGRKRLIVGNHDGGKTIALKWHAAPEHAAHFRDHGVRITLSHYAMRTWPGSHAGALMLYGHSHGRLPGNSQSTDVGVDAWDFRPVGLDEIRARLVGLDPYVSGETRLTTAV